MRTKQIVFVLIALLTSNFFIRAQTVINTSKKFEIIYLADVEYAVNELWLNRIRDDWKATGVNLRIWWLRIEDANGKFKWNNPSYNFDDAITKIATAKLNIYIRINFTLTNIEAVKNYNNDDFHTRSNGKIFLNVYNTNKPLLNLTSKKSLSDMLGFLSKLVNHLNSFPYNIRSKIKIVVPSLSPDDETELTFNTYDDSTKTIINNVLTDYSRPEISAFMKFLKNKYGSIETLNESWCDGANFTDFDSSQIRIRNYNWDGIKTNPKAQDYYVYENGRKDFLDFRREELKKFIDDCSAIVRKAGFNFGVQFGSIYDTFVEFRGFYDPTPLLEKVDLFITDDILEYAPNFSFSADYSRSLCKYWTWKNKCKDRKSFATETNWIGYEGHSSENLIKYWSLQLRTFYERGASCLFVSHWGTEDSPTKVPAMILNDSSLSEYKAWQDTLQKFQNAPVKKIVNDYAYHLACEQGLNFIIKSNNNDQQTDTFIHNNGFVVDKIDGKNIIEFPLNRFSKHHVNKGDFVTSYMLKYSPDYVGKNYKKISKTGTSMFMSKEIKYEF